jgi:hypothetical protein
MSVRLTGIITGKRSSATDRALLTIDGKWGGTEHEIPWCANRQ